MTQLKQQYLQQVVPALQQQLGYSNIWRLPRVRAAVVNVGLGSGLKDPKFLEVVTSTLRRITGQQPVPTLAKQSIANFKIRRGQVVGLKVTLRGERMESFLFKLIHVTLPRVRDFRGLEPTAVDGNGNLTIGVKENIAFPEISANEVERLHGVEITVVTSAKNRAEGLALLRLLGFPLRQTESGHA